VGFAGRREIGQIGLCWLIGRAWMKNATSFNPHKEEDEGYLAARNGERISDNPYPRGTIRYDEWRRGWHIKREETQKEKDEGYQAAKAGQRIGENPYPRGTIRYDEWRRGWHVKTDEIQRAARLANTNDDPEK
jgi:hypothetical protein